MSTVAVAPAAPRSAARGRRTRTAVQTRWPSTRGGAARAVKCLEDPVSPPRKGVRPFHRSNRLPSAAHGARVRTGRRGRTEEGSQGASHRLGGGDEKKHPTPLLGECLFWKHPLVRLLSLSKVEGLSVLVMNPVSGLTGATKVGNKESGSPPIEIPLDSLVWIHSLIPYSAQVETCASLDSLSKPLGRALGP